MTTPPIVYLNGQFLPQDQAFVPVMDRGFIFGDGVYEVIPVYGGRLFRLQEHLKRLDSSLAGIRLTNPLTHNQWAEVLQQLVEKNGGGNQSLYLQLTRGHAPRDHAFPSDTPPTLFAATSALKTVPAQTLKNGIKAITLEDIRWRYCHIKAIALLPNILLRQQAIDAGAQEAILVRDGVVTEGSASNLFIVHHGVIKTPPKSSYLLPGITRDLVLELAVSNGLRAEEAQITPQALAEAEEVWISSSTKEVVPVTELDGEKVGSGKPGPVWQKIRRLYQAYKEKLIAGEAE